MPCIFFFRVSFVMLLFYNLFRRFSRAHEPSTGNHKWKTYSLQRSPIMTMNISYMLTTCSRLEHSIYDSFTMAFTDVNFNASKGRHNLHTNISDAYNALTSVAFVSCNKNKNIKFNPVVNTWCCSQSLRHVFFFPVACPCLYSEWTLDVLLMV